MERLKRLTEFWKWLPAFRVVAETQHLRRAAEILEISPSALSRTIQLTEQALGMSLFHREGRGIRLTASGEQLLVSVRDAMRLLDDGVERMSARRFGSLLRVAVEADLMPMLSVALQSLQAEDPELVVQLTCLQPGAGGTSLMDGSLDLLLTYSPLPHVGVETHLMVAWPRALYCNPSHPMASRSQWSPEDFADQSFATLPDSKVLADGWPPEFARHVSFLAESLEVRTRLCRESNMLLVLPEPIGDAQPGLMKLEVPWLEPQKVFALCRGALTELDFVGLVLEALGSALGSPGAVEVPTDAS